MAYPFTTPVVLTDAIFNAYGGQVGSTNAAQREAAYVIAEMTVSDDLDTLLVNTRLTGTYHPLLSDQYMLTEYAYVTGFHIVNYYDHEENLLLSVSGTSEGYFNVRNWDLGMIDYFYPVYYGMPYRMEYIYNAGLSTEVANSPSILLALTTYANIILNEIMGYGNEAVGDIGVQDFSNQQYRESRVTLLRTSFGTSAKAQFIQKLLSRYKLHRYAGRGL